MRNLDRTNGWWRNEHACEERGKCDYIDWCYSNRQIGPDEIPENFKKRGK